MFLAEFLASLDCPSGKSRVYMETDVERWWNDRGRRTEVMGEKHYIAWVVGEWMGMGRWWNGADRGN